jgi:hypothetical protein
MNTNEIPCKEIFETITFDLLDHLGSHHIDPCNVLIGRPPSQSVIETLQPIGTSSNDDEKSELDENEPNLYDLVQRWNTIGMHWNRVAKEMTTVLEKMKSKLKYQKGDLVVVNAGYVFESFG